MSGTGITLLLLSIIDASHSNAMSVTVKVSSPISASLHIAKVGYFFSPFLANVNWPILGPLRRLANKDEISVSVSFRNYIHNYFMIILMKFVILKFNIFYSIKETLVW